MPEDLMRYDQLAQHALRMGVVREALRRVEVQGLPGDHHFYITFETTFPGVSISETMREKYPREMTIVLQHQFDDLKVLDDAFSVKLFFNDVAERLVIPFMAIKAFFDPAIAFGLQFEVVTATAAPPLEAGSVSALPLRVQPHNKADADEPGDSATPEGPETTSPDEGPKVVSLDAFRKK